MSSNGSRTCALVILCVTGVVTTAAVEPPSAWPEPADYFYPTCPDGQPSDVIADAPAGNFERDIVGSTEFPAFGVHDDGTYIFMRTRVDADPQASGGSAPLAQFGWGVGINTDDDYSDTEYSAVLDGIKEVLRLVRTDDGAELMTWEPTVGGWANVEYPTSDGSMLGGDADAFIDFAIPLVELVTLTQNDPSPFVPGKTAFWVATSTNGSSLDKDFMCWDDGNGAPLLGEVSLEPVVLGPFVDILSPADGGTVVSTTPELSGEAGQSAVVTLEYGAESVDVVADAEGNWSFVVPESWGLSFGGEFEIFATVASGDANIPDGTDSVVFTISCPAGFIQVGEGCVDVDECSDPALNDCDSNAFCTNVDGGFVCECDPGYQGTGQLCSDVDECSDPALNECDPNAACINEIGSYICQCDSGFEGDGQLCVDVDECSDPALNECDSNAACINEIGSYICQCDSGFEGDGQLCVDVDECSDPALNDCDVNAACANEDGGYACACNPGFEGDGETCDVAGCPAEVSDLCSVNASCQEVDGAYACVCDPGFEGEGQT